MGSDRPVVCLLIDAFRHDYLTEERSPYLSALTRERGWSRMRPILGYSDSIRATVLTGAYPDEHGYWMEYCRRPRTAPLRELAKLRALDRLPSDLLRRTAKFALSQTAARRIAHNHGYSVLSLRHFPLRALDQFDWTLRGSMSEPEAFPVPTIFDDLRGAGRKWALLDASQGGARGVLGAAEALDRDTAFVFVYLHQIDFASHVIGIESRLFDRVVKRVDRLAEATVKRIADRLGDLDLVVFSDHGMSKVTRYVGFPDLWVHPAFPDEFCFALDATMIRLWHQGAPASLREEVRERIRTGAPGRFLTADELGDLHLDLGSRLYGDEIYLLEPGTVVHPNFHSLIRPRAMHAYHPDDGDQHGILIGPPGEDLGEVAELVDVTALVRHRTGVGHVRDGSRKPSGPPR